MTKHAFSCGVVISLGLWAAVSTSCQIAESQARDAGPRPRRDAAQQRDAAAPDAAAQTTAHSIRGVRLEGELAQEFNLGDGYNSLAEDRRGHCFRGVREQRRRGGARTSYTLRIIEDASSIRERLGVSATASFGGGPFHGSASFSYASSNEVSNYSMYVVVESRTVLPSVFIDPRSLQLTAEELAALRTNARQYVARCGDMFVSEIGQGGSFRAVYQLHDISERRRSAITAQVGGSYMTFSAGGDLTQALERAISQRRVSVEIWQSGGQRQRFTGTPSEVVARAEQFAQSVTPDNAWPLSVTMQSYQVAPGTPFDAFPDYDRARMALQSLARARDKATTVVHDVERRLAIGNLAAPQCSDAQGRLFNRRRDLEQYIGRLDGAARQCFAEPGRCAAQISPAPQLSLPELGPLARQCSPACSTDADTTFEIDSFGYCTRCRRTPPAPHVGHGSNGLETLCRHMRPDARVGVRYIGTDVHVSQNRPERVDGTSWMQVFLQTSAGGACSNGCTSDDCCMRERADDVDYDVWLNNEAVADADGTVRAWLHADRCTGPRGDTLCWMSGSRMEICDPDSSASCWTQ